jgi:hypothetical protein
MQFGTWLGLLGDCTVQFGTWLGLLGYCTMQSGTWLARLGFSSVQSGTWMGLLGYCTLQFGTWLGLLGHCRVQFGRWLGLLGYDKSLLWWWTFLFNSRQGICWAAEKLLVFYVGLRSVELVWEHLKSFRCRQWVFTMEQGELSPLWYIAPRLRKTWFIQATFGGNDYSSSRVFSYVGFVMTKVIPRQNVSALKHARTANKPNTFSTKTWFWALRQLSDTVCTTWYGNRSHNIHKKSVACRFLIKWRHP